MNNNKQEIVSKIHEILRDVTGLSESDLSDTTPLVDLPSIDSMMMLNFIVKLEAAFKIRFDMDNVDEIFFSVDSLADFLLTHN